MLGSDVMVCVEASGRVSSTSAPPPAKLRIEWDSHRRNDVACDVRGFISGCSAIWVHNWHIFTKRRLPSSKITWMAMQLITLILSHHAVVLLLQLLDILFCPGWLKIFVNDLFSTMSSGDIYERHTHTYRWNDFNSQMFWCCTKQTSHHHRKLFLSS